MSVPINYFPCRLPVTSLRVEHLGGHCHIGVWINHGKAGELVCREDESEDFVALFSTAETRSSIYDPAKLFESKCGDGA